MQKVWFRCDRKNDNMFVLNSCLEMDYIPIVGDTIEPSNKDFMNGTFRVKPWYYDKHNKRIKDCIALRFKVVSRKFDLTRNEWELICEPTSESLLYLLRKIKTTK